MDGVLNVTNSCAQIFHPFELCPIKWKGLTLIRKSTLKFVSGRKKIIKPNIKKGKKLKRGTKPEKKYKRKRKNRGERKVEMIHTATCKKDIWSRDHHFKSFQQEETGKSYQWVISLFSSISHSREKWQNIAHTLIKNISVSLLCFGTF